jgi:hypothetical protein
MLGKRYYPYKRVLSKFWQPTKLFVGVNREQVQIEV